jgi:hypothetical protein
MRTSQELMSAQAGVIIVNDTIAVVNQFHAVYVLEDTVFTTLEDEAGRGVGDYITDPLTAVKAGAMITPFDRNNPFKEIELASGSVSIIL